jgi:hypothetical protein
MGAITTGGSETETGRDAVLRISFLTTCVDGCSLGVRTGVGVDVDVDVGAREGVGVGVGVYEGTDVDAGAIEDTG